MDVDSNKDTLIKSWWKKVTNNPISKPVSQKQGNKKERERESSNFLKYIHEKKDQIFGVPLQDSLRCARAAIAYVDNDVQYCGFIPVIVAKCGSYLKDQGKYIYVKVLLCITYTYI